MKTGLFCEERSQMRSSSFPSHKIKKNPKKLKQTKPTKITPPVLYITSTTSSTAGFLNILELFSPLDKFSWLLFPPEAISAKPG